jgi:hypothetical protein
LRRIPLEAEAIPDAATLPTLRVGRIGEASGFSLRRLAQCAALIAPYQSSARGILAPARPPPAREGFLAGTAA